MTDNYKSNNQNKINCLLDGGVKTQVMLKLKNELLKIHKFCKGWSRVNLILLIKYSGWCILPMILILSGCISKVPESTTTTKPINCLNIAKGSGDLVCLLNNESAKDPTWNELIAFLRKDNTDKYDYVPSSFVCADFAEILHNNAEAAGIRAGFVYVEFVDNPENHSLNVFNTTDKGLVFVDVVPNMNNTKHSDKIAYVIEGMEYGLISIDYAKSPDYSFYLSYRATVSYTHLTLPTKA